MIILKHNVEGKLNDYLTFTLFRYIAIIPVDGKDMAITRSENSKIRIDTNHNQRRNSLELHVFHHAKTQIGCKKLC